MFARPSGRTVRSGAFQHSRSGGGHSPLSFDPSYLMRMVSQLSSMNHPTRQVGLADVGVMTDLATATAPRRLSVVRLARMSLTSLVERGAARPAGYFGLASISLKSPRSRRRGGRTIASRSTATSVRVCLASWVEAALISRDNDHCQVAVTHSGRWLESKSCPRQRNPTW